jgi:hypothetical protein
MWLRQWETIVFSGTSPRDATNQLNAWCERLAETKRPLVIWTNGAPALYMTHRALPPAGYEIHVTALFIASEGF